MRRTHDDHRTRSMTKTLTKALLLVAFLAPAASAQLAAPLEATGPHSARPGWTLAVGVGGAQLDLDSTLEQRLEAVGLSVSDTGQGLDLAVGYSFGDEFAIALRASGRELSTGRPELDAVFGQLVLEMTAPLNPGERVSPYAAGSLGAAALAFEGSGVPDRSFTGGQLGFGGGIEVRVSDHVAFDFHYRYAIARYDRESVESGSGDREVDVEGVGRAHVWGMRVLYAF